MHFETYIFLGIQLIPHSPQKAKYISLTLFVGENIMPRGDKSNYTDKQKRQAEHIEEGYEKKGVSKKEAEARAWATVNKESGGGKKSGSGRAKHATSESDKKSASTKTPARTRTAAERSASAKKAAQTRARNAKNGA